MSRILHLPAEELAERRMKVKALFGYGLSAAEIGERLGMLRTLVYYDLKAVGYGGKSAGRTKQRGTSAKPRKRARKKPDFFSFLREK